jgi:hypothetical protein
MANLWKRIVKQQMIEEHESVPKYQWETYSKQGWHTREQVAEALECHEDKVQVILKSALASGKIERRDFTIWDRLNKELVKVAAYREKGKHADPKEEKPVARRGRGRPRKVRPKIVAGMSVRARSGNMGRIAEVRGGRVRVDWDSGKATESSLKAFDRGDIGLEL